MEIWLTESLYENPEKAQEAALTLVSEVPKLKGFVIQYGSILVIRNSTKMKAKEAKTWVKKFTIPTDTEIRREKRITEIGEELKKWQRRAGKAGEHLLSVKEARAIHETEGGIVGEIRGMYEKYKGKEPVEKRVY